MANGSALVLNSTDSWTAGVRFWLRETTGAFGDIGTFVPILIGMVHYVGMDAATILVFAGLAHLITGWMFRIPMAVQPMKVIAALAIAGELTSAQVTVAGLSVAVCLLILSLTGGIRCLENWIPRPLTAGIQLTVAMKLAVKGIAIMAGAVRSTEVGYHALLLTLFLVLALAIVLYWTDYRQHIIIVLILMGFGAAAMIRPDLQQGTESFALWRPVGVAWEVSALAGIMEGGLAQLPLTLLNSVFAVTLLAHQLHPQKRHRVAVTRVSLSVALINLVALPFGAMPMCHGSGGLAAQHACGARSGRSMLILGALKLGLGLFGGTLAIQWLQAFPESIMGLFLVIAAWTLSKASGFWTSPLQGICSMVMALATWLSGCLPLGFALAWGAHGLVTRIGKLET